MEATRFRNGDYLPPLNDSEVLKVAHSAWNMTINGKNRFGAPPKVIVDHRTVDTLAARNPDAFALLIILERHHASNDVFFLAKAMAASLGWGARRWRAAREHLVKVSSATSASLISMVKQRRPERRRSRWAAYPVFAGRRSRSKRPPGFCMA
jgi:hypothetical protein